MTESKLDPASTPASHLQDSESAEEDVSRLLSGGGVAIPLFKVHMPDTASAAVAATLESGYIGQGPKVDAFEQALSSWFGSENVLTTNSGTSALQLALRLAGVGPGDEVISTAMTCTASNMPIMAAGADIVWADIDPATGNLDLLDVERKITEKTRAILAVHWAGYPCDLAELARIADAHDVRIIEDAAHAFGATYRGRPVGSHSDFVCFSFQAIKHLTTVDGGAVVCRDSDDYHRGRLLRWYGIDRETERKDFRCEEDIKEWGYKFHMNDVAATLGLEQLPHMHELLSKTRANARHFRKHFANLSRLRLLEDADDRQSSYWLFTVRVEERLDFMAAMQDAGVTVSQVHARNDSHTCFARFRRVLPGVDRFVAQQVCIPVGWWLTDAQRDHIVETVVRLCR